MNGGDGDTYELFVREVFCADTGEGCEECAGDER